MVKTRVVKFMGAERTVAKRERCYAVAMQLCSNCAVGVAKQCGQLGSENARVSKTRDRKLTGHATWQQALAVRVLGHNGISVRDLSAAQVGPLSPAALRLRTLPLGKQGACTATLYLTSDRATRIGSS